MRVVICHNYYRQRGGEDQVFEDETELLLSHGHEVETFIRKNDQFSGLQTITVAAGTAWNRSSASAVGELVREHKADVVHFHNWLPQISQAAFYAARDAGAAVVRTMHNYRAMCAQGVLFRDGKVCEDCVGSAVGWPAIKHGCYRGSRAATVPLVTALATHRALRTHTRAVDATIALTEFARSMFVSAGLPGDRMYVKPNFVAPDPGQRAGEGEYVVYVGRLEDTKGIATLLEAWELMASPPLLRIAGSGPEQGIVEEAAARIPQIDYLGHVPGSKIADIVGQARFTMIPTLNYEGFPKVIVESFAVGTPVIGSDLGSVGEIIASGRTGYLFRAGDAALMADAVQRAAAQLEPGRMRDEVRQEYLRLYTADRNYDRLIEIYESALATRRREV